MGNPAFQTPHADSFATDEFGIIRLRKQHHLTDAASSLAEAAGSQRIIRLSRSSFMDFAQFHNALPWHQHLLSTAANAGDFHNAVIVGHSAALWHGLWIYDHAPTEVELHRCPATRGFDTGIRHYDAPVTEEDETIVDSLPVTTVARTILDVHRMHGPGAAFVTLCSALKLGLCTTADIQEAYDKVSWKQRLSGLDRVLEHATGSHNSPLEAIAHAQTALTQFVDLNPRKEGNTFILSEGTTFTVDTTACPLNDQALAQEQPQDSIDGNATTAHTTGPDSKVVNAASIFSGGFLTDILTPLCEDDNEIVPLNERIRAELANMFF